MLGDGDLYESIGIIYKGALLVFALHDCMAHHRSETLCSSFLPFYRGATLEYSDNDIPSDPIWRGLQNEFLLSKHGTLSFYFLFS